MADALVSLGEPILDHILVLNVLRGLNERYSHMAALLKRTRPFLSYSDVRADLLIEEMTLANKSSTLMALVATTPARLPGPHPGVPSSGASSSTNTNRHGNVNNGNQGGSSNRGGSN
jgi:hypothetical protein